MGSLDFSVVIVLGALVGLLFVAIGYGQLVWLKRQAKATQLEGGSGSPLLSTLFWLTLVAAALCLLRAATSRGLPEQDATLAGEDLFSVAVRQGLIAQYESKNSSVHAGEVLLRFTGREGEEWQLALKSRRQILNSDLEIEKARPTALDPELSRRLDQAKQVLQDRRSRQMQVLAERDSIAREATQQKLNVDSRRFRAEQDLRSANSELVPLRSSLEMAKSELESQEDLLRQGLLSKMELARQRDKVTGLEGQISEREERRDLLARELKAIGSLDEVAEHTYSGQGASRTAESHGIAGEIADAEKAVDDATQALERDRPRATAQQEKKIQQIQVQIAECDALLNGNGKKAQVVAPYDARVGFREPSPASPPADSGPLLVLYRPGQITATVHFDGTAEDDAGDDLAADVIFPAEAAGRERRLGGSVVSKTLTHDEEEIVVATDPPERVVRRLAMGVPVPVRVQLKRGVTRELTFRLGLGLGLLALALAGIRAIKRRFLPSTPPPAGPTSGNAGPTPGGTPPFGGGGQFNPSGQFASAARAHAAWYGSAAGYGSLDPYSHPLSALPYAPPVPALPSAALQTHPVANPFARPPSDSLAADESNPIYLRRLGARLRHDVDMTCLSPGIVHRVHSVIGRGGFPIAAQVVAGFGADVEQRQVARAVYDLHIRTAESAPPQGGLGQAVVSCAQFLQVMRAMGSDRLHEAIDAARSDLIVATLAVAERHGSTRDGAGLLVKPLMEV